MVGVVRIMVAILAVLAIAAERPAIETDFQPQEPASHESCNHSDSHDVARSGGTTCPTQARYWSLRRPMTSSGFRLLCVRSLRKIVCRSHYTDSDRPQSTTALVALHCLLTV